MEEKSSRFWTGHITRLALTASSAGIALPFMPTSSSFSCSFPFLTTPLLLQGTAISIFWEFTLFPTDLNVLLGSRVQESRSLRASGPSVPIWQLLPSSAFLGQRFSGTWAWSVEGRGISSSWLAGLAQESLSLESLFTHLHSPYAFLKPLYPPQTCSYLRGPG